MSTSTTAYLPDGRHVDVPEQAARDWARDAGQLDTTIGLADWYTDQGDDNQDEIHGTADDEPRCQHLYEDEPKTNLTRIRVVNASQSDAYDPDCAMASTWVCGARTCILDAMAWVERATGERAVWLDAVTADLHTLAPMSDLNGSSAPVFPISPEAAAAMMDEKGCVSVIISIDRGTFLEHVTGTRQDRIVEDFVHEKAFAFGATSAGTAVPIGVDGETFIIEYRTCIADALAMHEEDAQ
ncbi:hypothetical protein [Cryobacterium zhongshanensis]|uniref:Uncharacterized protein n=1 Tax=Cryobacterium zhongshanensis TaxID=2928153 RepID=A0AA41UMB7_9MICO|nr:hypothetical protein [Cryobacterium zhongshanensis]MCI4659691.1 hypothetical protein [Cryobacterium zhongshanensis]